MNADGLFFHDPWWLALAKAVLAVVVLLLWTIMNVWFERRTFAKMLQRIGPNMNGPLGLWQTIAEGVKCLLKEDFAPGHVDKWVYNLAPILTGVAAFSTWAVLPLGGEVSIFGHTTRLQVIDLPVAVLYIFAVASIGIYGIVLAGWASSDSYSLLGSLRSSAQMISYEVAMGLSLVPVFLASGTMSTSGIADAQAQHILFRGVDLGLPAWYFLLLFPSFCIFGISALGEANRTPFDLSECEQELVSGHITEYTGFRYALYYLGEYIAMATQASIATTLFLGGYHAPWPINWIAPSLDPTVGQGNGWWGLLWFFLKAQVLIFVIIWIRASVPRFRYDQFMSLGWKRLIPISLVWIVAVATWMTAADNGWFATTAGRVGVGVICLGLLAWAFWPQKKKQEEVATASGEFDAFAGGYPVPPMPGQVLPELVTTVKEA
ncbi:MAG: NADH-quinone oxidoreductase subunit NuoH [Propionibacteriaceae bacterium]